MKKNMKIQRIILLIVLLYVIVEARKHGRRENRKPLHLTKLLIGVLTEKLNKVPSVGSLGSSPAVGSLNSKPLIGEINSQACYDQTTWCSNYLSYCTHPTVRKYCQKSCKFCQTPATTTGPSTTSVCKDKHPSCSVGLKYNYCTGQQNQINFMKKYCQKSCKFCDDKPKCVDAQGTKYCEKIKASGYCTNKYYTVFVKKHCSKTCNYCDGFTCGVAPQRSKNNGGVIIGGVDSKKGYFPWQAAIYYKNEFICGGALISKTYILTAAHCFKYRSKDPSTYKVVLGEHHRKYSEGTEESINIKRVTIHESYKIAEEDNDIAIMEMAARATLNSHVNPICLPEHAYVLKAGTQCYVTGWGKITHNGESVDILQQVKLPIASKTHCEQRNTFNFHTITNNMVCAGYNNGANYQSGCHGDSGGPLSCEMSPGVWTLQGVVSWGSPLCNGLDRYTVFARVSRYVQWIKQQIA